MNKLKNVLFFGMYILSRPYLWLLPFQRVYLPIYVQFEWLKKYDIDTVIDIGAYHGDVTLALHRFFPNAQLYVFEPIPECCSIIRQNIKSKKLIINNFALSNKEGKQTFYQHDYAPASSMLPVTNEMQTTHPSHQITVQTKTLDGYFKNKKLKKKVFLKIDVQGAEMLVFKAGRQTLKQVDIIHIETSFDQTYKNQTYFVEIYSLLIEEGFTYKGSVRESEFYSTFAPRDQENSIFIRE